MREDRREYIEEVMRKTLKNCGVVLLKLAKFLLTILLTMLDIIVTTLAGVFKHFIPTFIICLIFVLGMNLIIPVFESECMVTALGMSFIVRSILYVAELYVEKGMF